MSLIVARPRPPAQPTREQELRDQAEALLRAATDDLLRANRGMERVVRLAAKYGVSQRGIEDITGINRRRIRAIITTTEAGASGETCED